ncbi:hypothetical protein BS17DRAFT_690426, partial [Gyrodon lividus]
CWTCQMRGKKCDEQREGNSCWTCDRLKLKCLGWEPKQEWMQVCTINLQFTFADRLVGQASKGGIRKRVQVVQDLSRNVRVWWVTY